MPDNKYQDNKVLINHVWLPKKKKSVKTTYKS